MQADTSSPGPGNYNPVVAKESLSYSLRSRPVEKTVERAPGPGRYDPKTEFVLESPVGVALGRSEQKFVAEIEKHSKKIPGPGAYNKPTTPAGPRWGFGSSLRAPGKEQNVPGPGTYNI